jgi:hypothetical protein
VEHLPSVLRLQTSNNRSRRNGTAAAPSGPPPAARNHSKWCTIQQARDRVLSARLEASGGSVSALAEFMESIVMCPRAEDCLFGKGMPTMRHPGNVAMRRLLEPRYERYERAGYRDKAAIAWEVVDEIKQGTGRFLKEDPDGWFVQVGDEMARQKISIAFRDMKRPRKRNGGQSGSNTTTTTNNNSSSDETAAPGRTPVGQVETITRTTTADDVVLSVGPSNDGPSDNSACTPANSFLSQKRGQQNDVLDDQALMDMSLDSELLSPSLLYLSDLHNLDGTRLDLFPKRLKLTDTGR